MNDTSCVHSFHPDYFVQVIRAKEETANAINHAWHNSEEYHRAYARHFVEGSIAAIANATHKDSSYSVLMRLRILKTICTNQELHNAISTCGYHGGIYDLLIQGKYVNIYLRDTLLYHKISALKYIYKAQGIKGVISKCMQLLKK